jgi:hypothetical protein
MPYENHENSTYYTSAKGFFTDCSLRVGIMHPDSINGLYIQTFLDDRETDGDIADLRYFKIEVFTYIFSIMTVYED